MITGVDVRLHHIVIHLVHGGHHVSRHLVLQTIEYWVFDHVSCGVSPKSDFCFKCWFVSCLYMFLLPSSASTHSCLALSLCFFLLGLLSLFSAPLFFFPRSSLVSLLASLSPLRPWLLFLFLHLLSFLCPLCYPFSRSPSSAAALSSKPRRVSLSSHHLFERRPPFLAILSSPLFLALLSSLFSRWETIFSVLRSLSALRFALFSRSCSYPFSLHSFFFPTVSLGSYWHRPGGMDSYLLVARCEALLCQSLA